MGINAKVAAGTVVIATVIGYVAYLGASSSWRYYLLVDECTAQADHLAGARLRVSGSVVTGSLSVADDRRRATFRLRGVESELPVTVSGTIPDNLAEGMEVVVEGALHGDGQIHADRVITRCASKYAPKNASASTPQGASTSP